MEAISMKSLQRLTYMALGLLIGLSFAFAINAFAVAGVENL
jgi:hypothetical protein